jgi:hypothetical protein
MFIVLANPCGSGQSCRQDFAVEALQSQITIKSLIRRRPELGSTGPKPKNVSRSRRISKTAWSLLKGPARAPAAQLAQLVDEMHEIMQAVNMWERSIPAKKKSKNKEGFERLRLLLVSYEQLRRRPAPVSPPQSSFGSLRACELAKRPPAPCEPPMKYFPSRACACIQLGKVLGFMPEEP